MKYRAKILLFVDIRKRNADFSLVTERKEVCTWINQHDRHLAMANDIVLGWAKEPIIQPILATGSEEDKRRILVIGYWRLVQFFVDMETIAFGYALFVGDCFASALNDGLNVRDDALGVAFGLAAIVIRA